MTYTEELSNAINEAREILEKDFLPKMKDEYSLQATTMHGMLALLITKRMIYSDRYSYDDNVASIDLANTNPFPDNERASVLGERLTHYVHSLDFIVNHFEFTVKFLSHKKIATLQNLTKVFVWEEFNEKGPSPNTAALASIIKKSNSSIDKFTSDVLRNSLDQMAKSAISIKSTLLKLAIYQKESYKLFIRKSVVAEIPEKSLSFTNDPKSIFLAIKKVFAEMFSKKPFFQDLIMEVIKEDYTSEGDKLKNSTLDTLNFLNENKKNLKQIDNSRFLISGLKILANSAPQFSTVLERISFNEELIKNETSSFFTKFLDLLRKAFNIKVAEKEITVLIDDPITQSRKKETINLSSFKAAISNKISLFNTIIHPSFQSNIQVEQISEEKLFQDLAQYIFECNSLLDKMSGLDTYYKSVKPELRKKIKGIKVEITTIKNSIINAMQYKAEYISRVEATKQLKVMGIH